VEVLACLLPTRLVLLVLLVLLVCLML